MSKKAIRKENVEIRSYVDGMLIDTSVEKNRHIFLDKDGHEYITGSGRVRRDRNGTLYAERKAVTIEPLRIFDVIERVRKTGGVVVQCSTNKKEQ